MCSKQYFKFYFFQTFSDRYDKLEYDVRLYLYKIIAKNRNQFETACWEMKTCALFLIIGCVSGRIVLRLKERNLSDFILRRKREIITTMIFEPFSLVHSILSIIFKFHHKKKRKIIKISNNHLKSKFQVWFFTSTAITLVTSARFITDDHSIALNSSNRISWRECSSEFSSKSNSNCFNSTFRFAANVSQLESECVESSEIILNYVSWRVKLCKQNETNSVGVYLESFLNSNVSYWSCEAEASFKLFPVDANDRPIIRNLTKHKYTNESSSIGIEEFADWDEFMLKYTSENVANFEIEISTSPLEHTPPNVMNPIYTRLHIMLNGVTNEPNAQFDYYSPEVTVQGVKWRIRIQRIDKYLGISLEANDDDLDLSFSYKVDAEFKLFTFSDPDTTIREPISNQFTHYYRHGWPKMGFANFIEWHDFVHPKHDYVVRNKANFFIQFKVEQPKSVWDDDQPEISTGKQSLACTLCDDEFVNGKIVSMKCGHLLCKHCRDSHIPTHICTVCGTQSATHQLNPIIFGNMKEEWERIQSEIINGKENFDLTKQLNSFSLNFCLKLWKI